MTQIVSLPFNSKSELHCALAYAYRCDPAAWAGSYTDTAYKRDEYINSLAMLQGLHLANVSFVTAGENIIGMFEVGPRKDLSSQTVAFHTDDKTIGYIHFLYVRPDMRGSGYGRAALALAEQTLRTQGFTKLQTSSVIAHPTNTQFYTACGWKNLGQRTERPKCQLWEKM